MISQLLTGSAVIVLSIFIEVAFIFIAIKFLRSLSSSDNSAPTLLRMMILLSGVTLWMLAAFSLVCWIWAATLWMVGALGDIESALYFSMVAFTTLGFGDIVLDQPWRLLSGMMAANGLVLFGLNTAMIVETLRGLLNAKNQAAT